MKVLFFRLSLRFSFNYKFSVRNSLYIDKLLLCAVNDESSTSQPSKKSKRSNTPKKLAKIFDGRYFAVVIEVGEEENSKGEKIAARCTVCNEVKNGSYTSTGNFKSHYSKMHSDRLKELEDYLANKSTPNDKTRQPLLQEVLCKGDASNV